MTYKEHIYEVCTKTDLDDREDVTETMQWLASELIRMTDIALLQESKLMEIMTAKEYGKFTTDLGKELFRKSIEEMEDSDYKEFCIEHFDEITGGNI